MSYPEEELEIDDASDDSNSKRYNQGYEFENSSSDESGAENFPTSKSSSKLIRSSSSSEIKVNYSDKKIYEDDYGLSSEGEEKEDLDPQEAYKSDSKESTGSSSEHINLGPKKNKKIKKQKKNSLFANPNLLGATFETPSYQEDLNYYNESLKSGEEIFDRDNKRVDPQEVIK